MSGPMGGPKVFDWLTADPAVTAFVTNSGNTDVPFRIFGKGVAPQGTQAPYIVWFVIDAPPENTLSERPAVARYSVQVDCWHRNERGVEELAKAVRNCLEVQGHQTGQPIDGRETETKLWRFSMTFDFWVHREP